MSVLDNDGFLRGRRAIMSFIKVKQWRTVQKYRKHYSMPVMEWPNGRPVALKHELMLWVIKYNEIMKRHREKEGK